MRRWTNAKIIRWIGCTMFELQVLKWVFFQIFHFQFSMFSLKILMNCKFVTQFGLSVYQDILNKLCVRILILQKTLSLFLQIDQRGQIEDVWKLPEKPLSLARTLISMVRWTYAKFSLRSVDQCYSYCPLRAKK